MSKGQMLRAFVEQRLTVAAAEIFGLFERTIAEYEEELTRSKEENERQRRQMDAVVARQLRLQRADVQQLNEEEVTLNQQVLSSGLDQEDPQPPHIKKEQQEWSISLDQVDPEPPHIKEEQEKCCTSQEGEQLQGVEEPGIIPLLLVAVKSEGDYEERLQSSQLHQRQTEQMETAADGEDCGGPEPAGNSDHSGDWKETRQPQSESTTVILDFQILPDDSSHTSLTSLSSPLPCSSSSLSSISSSSSEPSTPFTSHSQRHSANIPSKWHEIFEVPWNKMPEEVQSAIATSKRPAPDKRRQMIRILADEIRKYDVNPTRSECLIICQNIVKQYPSSFADMTTGGVIIAGGFMSLLSQVKTRIENLNRAGTLKRHRTSRQSGQQRRPTDFYGCTQFQPDPPPEETNETVEQKRQQLVNIYRQEGIQGSERAEVINLMNTTFCLQRKNINQTPAPSIEDLRIQWPFLFTPRGLYCHFELLTDISVQRALELSIEESGQGIEKYLRTKLKNKDVEAEDGELTLCIIQLLMAYFDERTEGLILFADMSATAADVERTLNLPASPRLILQVAGDGVTLGNWMISIESQVICEGIQKTFITGLAAVFATYYVFNLQYQEEAARTLEFVQRRLIGINPERGRKSSLGKAVSKKTGKLVHKKATMVNPHVATLLKKLIDFEWGFM